MYLKFKEGSKTANNVGNDWILAVKLVAIPVEQKINVIWATTEKFDMFLKEIIFKLY